jgi:aspartate 1-decarboxylase
MMRIMMKSKIHNATVTEANIDYIGSITIDEALLEKANMTEGEQVHVLDLDNGTRLETYIIKGKRGSGIICINGPAARLIKKGDAVIIISYCMVEESELDKLHVIMVLVDKKNNFMKYLNE